MNTKEKQLEQYYFTEKTNKFIMEFIKPFNSVLFLCTPIAGLYFLKKETSKNILIMDIDEKYADNVFFELCDINNMKELKRSFDCVIFDPPAIRFSPEKTAELLKKNFSNGETILMAYPSSFFEKIKKEMDGLKLRLINEKPEYMESNDFNTKEMRFFTNFENSIN